ncbi:MAG: peptidase C45 [Planctomycetaceae bacterium]|nr:peptidase C45 [Planctomycetaceae bacterium]
MSKPTRYREIEVSGSPREVGRQIGEAAREETRGFCEVALERVNKTIVVSRERAFDTARQSTEFAEKYRPDLVEELRGTAEAAGVTLDELMLLQVRNQFTPDKEGGCTSFAIQSSATTSPVVAQTWDNDPVLDEFTIVLTRRPQGGPASMSCTQAGLISYMGFSETGIGACVNTLPAPSRAVGVPHYFTLRELFEADSLDKAVESVRRAHRAIPVNIMLATPDGPADLEVTIDDVHVLRPEDFGAITHTNHCVHPDLLSVNDDFPELIQSHSRKRQIDSLVGSVSGEIDALKSILGDHDGHPTSICRHVNDDPVNGFWVTVFALIIEPSERRMHVTRGTPCDHQFETYTLV